MKRPARSLRRPGFTLVELVLAGALVVIMGGVLFAGYYYSALAIRTVRRDVSRAESAAVFLYRLLDELAAVEGAEHALSGSGSEIVFVTSAGTARGLARVGYRVEEEGEQAVVYRFESLPWENGGEENSRPVYRARGFSFGYYDGQDWLEEWDHPEIPPLVSLSLSTDWEEYEVWARPRTGTGLDPGPDPDARPDGN